MVHLTNGIKQSRPFTVGDTEGERLAYSDMNDDRIFATKNQKPMNAEGKTVHIEDSPRLTMKGVIIIKRNRRRHLRPLLILLLFIEWTCDTAGKIWSAFHNGVKDVTLAIETYINEPDNTET